MDEVGDDPIRRAGLIGDIVKSIAVIPNDILRSEYIKRCSDMLKVSEQLLVSETAKIRMKRTYKPQIVATNKQPLRSRRRTACNKASLMRAKKIPYIIRNAR